MAKKPQVVNGQVHWVEEGQEASPTGEAAESSIWSHILPETSQIFGDLVSGTLSPNLNPLGGDQNAQDYILKHLESDPTQEWSWPREIAKAIGRGATQVFVPKAQVDVGAQAMGEAAGGALAGAIPAARGARALQAEDAARTTARQSATQKLQEAATSPQDVWQGPVGGGRPPGYHTQRGNNRRLNLGGDETPRLPGEAIPEGQKYRGPRPSDTDVEQFEMGGRPDRGIPGPTDQHPVNQARAASERASSRAGSHQLDMQRYRAGQEIARDLLEKEGRLPTPEEIAKIDDPVARKAVEDFVQNQGQVGLDLQEGRRIGGELSERRGIADELAQRREIQRELQDRRAVGAQLTPTQASPTQPMPPQPPTNRSATMPPPRGAPQGPATDRGATMPPRGGIGDVARREAQKRAAREAPTAPSPTQPMRAKVPFDPNNPRQAIYDNPGRADPNAPMFPSGHPMAAPPTQPMPPAPDNPLAALVPDQLPTGGRMDPTPTTFQNPRATTPQPGGRPTPMTQDQQIAALEDLPDYGHWRVNTLMQELFRNNPDMTLGQFMELMRRGGGSQGAPPLPF